MIVTKRRENKMKCERCESQMREQELFVLGGPIKTKGVSAWFCPDCGRIEFRNSITHNLILEDIESQHDAA